MLKQSTLFTLILLVLSIFSAAYAKDWQLVHGKGNPLCDDLYKKLKQHDNSKTSNIAYNCALAVVEAYPEFKAVPWSEAEEAKDHVGLLYELAKYRMYSNKYYFTGNLEEYEKRYSIKEYLARKEKSIQAMVEKQLKNNVQLQFWQAPIPDGLQWLQKYFPYVKGPFNFVRIIEPPEVPESHCKGYPQLTYSSTIFLVNDYLTGPDPRLDESKSWNNLDFKKWNNVRHLYYYQGVLHSIQAGYGIEVMRDGIQAPYSNSFCKIEYTKKI